MSVRRGFQHSITFRHKSRGILLLKDIVVEIAARTPLSVLQDVQMEQTDLQASEASDTVIPVPLPPQTGGSQSPAGTLTYVTR